jgi:hypothetical protein
VAASRGFCLDSVWTEEYCRPGIPDFASAGDLGVGVGTAQLISGTENQRRNQFFGPRYFDTDMTIMKYTQIPHWETAELGIGAQFFNLLNHRTSKVP